MKTDINFNPEIFRKDYPMVIAKNRHLASIGAVRLAYDADGYPAGTVLARNSVSGLYQAYDDGGSSGLNTAKCVMLDEFSVSEFEDTDATALARGIFGGELFYSKLIGIDANGITDLGGKRYIEADGVEVFKF